MTAIAHVTENDKQAERAIKTYIDLLEYTLDSAFNLLATDNVYSKNANEAWQLLGTVLEKVHSAQKPFEVPDIKKYLK